MLQPVINLLQSNRLSEALALCEQLMLKNKKNLDGWLLLADLYQKTGAFAKAEKSFRKVIKLKAVYAPAHTQLAMLYHGQGKFAKAEASYRQSLKLENNQPTVHFNLGAILQEQSKLDDAASQYRQAIKLKSDYAKAYANLGFVLRQQEKTEAAVESYRKALQFAPDVADIHYNMGLSLLNAGQAEAAEKYQRQALSLKPDYADALAGLGTVQFFNGDVEKAANSYQQALNQQPDNIEFLCSYANTLSALGLYEQAMTQIKKALKIEINNEDICITRGFIHLSLGQLDEAFDCCEQILKITPQHEKAMSLAASVYEKKGDAKLAYRYLAPLLEKEFPGLNAVLSFASISSALKLVDKAIEYLEQYLQNNSNVSLRNQSRLHFALGKAYDSQKNYEPAFKNYHTANKSKRAIFDIRNTREEVDAQVNVFSFRFSDHLAKSSIHSSRPIFIVGMPRSGTSLVEQILASHPQVAGAGELSDISNLAASMPQIDGLKNLYPQCLTQIDSKQLDSMAQVYLNRLSDVDDKTLHVTDKMPGNYMHLGLIQLLFPDARIIHCIRDPLDTCLSCYFQDFSQNHPWIYNLQDTGRMHLEYQRLMQHWKNVLNIPILDVCYEELVDNQEEISRKIISFCKLEWDESCLQFHKNERFIWTASYQQVRQPMYKKSVARWKNYEQHIEPLKKILGKL